MTVLFLAGCVDAISPPDETLSTMQDTAVTSPAAAPALAIDPLVVDFGEVSGTVAVHFPLSNTTDTGPETTAEPALQEMITLGADYAISGVGDVNGDGWPDLAIGAYRYGGRGDYTGAACLLLGGLEE